MTSAAHNVSMSSAAVAALLALCTLFEAGPRVAAAGGGFLSRPHIETEAVERSLIAELIHLVKLDNRPAEIEGLLRPTFDALPKNAEGKLNHQAVRYLLHRYFVNQHGWYIKGLEPSGDQWQVA